MKQLRDKKGLITGAASGIGRCLALALASEGVDLWLLDIDPDRLAETAHEARARQVEVRTSLCDLSRAEAISQTVREVLACWGYVDLLINNAGVAYYGSTERMTAAEWDWLLRVNLLAPIQLTHELLPVLLQRPEAHLLNVCSIAGLVASRRLAAYHVSKFGLVGLSEALRAEFNHRGLGVTALCPGLVRTRIFESAVVRNRSKPRRVPNWLSASPEAVARRAVRAIKRNQGLVLVTLLAHLLYLCKRLSPGLLGFINGFKRSRVKKRTSEEKSSFPLRKAS
jgi:short-subunit dehydrogenase